MVYVISRQTQYIVINNTDVSPPNEPAAQTMELQPWRSNSFHSGFEAVALQEGQPFFTAYAQQMPFSQAELKVQSDETQPSWDNASYSGSDFLTLQNVQPRSADCAQQLPCSHSELPSTGHGTGVANKDTIEITSACASPKSLSKAAKKKELAKTRRKIKRRRARKREADLLSLFELAPFTHAQSLPCSITNAKSGGGNEAKSSFDSCNSMFGKGPVNSQDINKSGPIYSFGKAALDHQSIEETEPISIGAYKAHPVQVLKQYAQGIMSQFDSLSDSDEEGNDMMSTESWKAAHRTLCECSNWVKRRGRA